MQSTSIIVTGFCGLPETKRCIESLLADGLSQARRVVAIIDEKSAPDVSAFLGDLAMQGRIDVIKDESSAAVTTSINRIMAAAGRNTHALLLSGRCEVAAGWLDRLLAAAAADPMVATASPFANGGELTGYPKSANTGHTATLPDGLTTVSMAAMFTKVNHNRVIDLPVGVGFAMLMTHAAIDAVGLFDAATFSRCDEAAIDWCLRASAAGFRHLLCADVFVSIAAAPAFEKSPATDLDEMPLIKRRYPQFAQLISTFVQKDPARPLRRAVDWLRLCHSPRPRVLFITHNLGGGVERHVHDLAQLLQDRAEVLVLRPAGDRVNKAVKLEWLRAGKDKAEDWCVWFSIPSNWSDLLSCLQSLDLARVHVHHLHGFAPAFWTLPAELGVPFDITLHDHWPLTPNYHLSTGGRIDDSATSAVWRQDAGRLLKAAARVFVPSQYLSNQILDAHPHLTLTLWPHPTVGQHGTIPACKVAVLGRMSPGKGLEVVLECARYAAWQGMPIHFRIIGPTTQRIPAYPALPIDLTGSYDDQDLAALLAIERPDIVFFPAQVPESFSYTLGTALETGLPIVASRLGAFTERLEHVANARLLAWDATAQQWCEALIALAASSNAHTHPTIQPTKQPTNGGFGAADYIAALPVIEAGHTIKDQLQPVPHAPRASAYFPVKHLGDSDALSMADLFTFGIDCGQREARTELKRRSHEVDIELETLEARRLVLEAELGDAADALENEMALTRELGEVNQSLNAHIASLDRQIVETQTEFMHVLASTRETLEHERDAARLAYDGITGSTSWKVTAPLRRLIHAVKQLLWLGRDAANSSKALPHQIAVAKQILREEGAVALGKRVHEKLVRREETPVAAALEYRQEPAILPLAMVTSRTPQISIVIPVYGQHVMTYTCLKSIHETCAGESIEVIVIDDCSPEPAADALAPVTGITVVRNDTNLGFLKNCNKAAAMAHGEFVLILNNDIIVTPGWLTAMRDVWSVRDDVGMVGAKLIYPDGRLQEAGGIVWRDGSAWNWGRNQDAGKPAYNYLREVDYTSGACLLLKRDFWNQLGGFDERYAPAYYEDTDLAFRVREAGKKVFYQPLAVVVHFEGQSSGTDITQGVKKHQVINQQTFLARWRGVLAKHRINGLLPQLERDRYAKRRVLVVDACMLTPDHDAGSLRMFELLGLMTRMGAKVTFLADNLEYREPYVSQIQALGVEVIYHPVESNVTRFIERHAAEYEVILLSRATVAVKHIDTVRMSAPRARVIFDTVDLHFLRQEREAELVDDAQMRAAALRMKAQELAIMEKADITLVVSPVEEKLLAGIAPSVRVEIVSIIHVNMPGPKSFAERSGVLFIGGFRHPPNLDAVTWYVENVLPILRARNAGIVTTVIGSNAPPSLQKFAADDFVIAGFVPDVTPHYDNARLSISPLRYGAGVKGKVNIAMQYGVPVIATTTSVEGMYLRDELDVLRADSAEAFADAMIRANTDEKLWQQLRVNGLANIDRYFSRATAARALASLLEIDA